MVHRPNCSLSTVADPNLSKDGFDVHLHRSFGNINLARNGFIRLPLDQAT